VRLVRLSLGGSGSDRSRCMQIADLVAVSQVLISFHSSRRGRGRGSTYQDILTAGFWVVFDVERD
jgi:hypothetical protein